MLGACACVWRDDEIDGKGWRSGAVAQCGKMERRIDGEWVLGVARLLPGIQSLPHVALLSAETFATV